MKIVANVVINVYAFLQYVQKAIKIVKDKLKRQEKI
jgi:hypothetical protein